MKGNIKTTEIRIGRGIKSRSRLWVAVSIFHGPRWTLNIEILQYSVNGNVICHHSISFHNYFESDSQAFISA